MLVEYFRDNNLFAFILLCRRDVIFLCLFLTNICGLNYNHQFRLQLFWYVAKRAQMPYLKATSLEPVEQGLFGRKV